MMEYLHYRIVEFDSSTRPTTEKKRKRNFDAPFDHRTQYNFIGCLLIFILQFHVTLLTIICFIFDHPVSKLERKFSKTLKHLDPPLSSSHKLSNLLYSVEELNIPYSIKSSDQKTIDLSTPDKIPTSKFPPIVLPLRAQFSDLYISPTSKSVLFSSRSRKLGNRFNRLKNNREPAALNSPGATPASSPSSNTTSQSPFDSTYVLQQKHRYTSLLSPYMASKKNKTRIATSEDDFQSSTPTPAKLSMPFLASSSKPSFVTELEFAETQLKLEKAGSNDGEPKPLNSVLQSIQGLRNRASKQIDLNQEEYDNYRYPPITSSVRVKFEGPEPELVEDAEQEIYTGNPSEILVEQKGGEEIKREDFQRLVGSAWLNDICINAWMNLLTERSKSYFEKQQEKLNYNNIIANGTESKSIHQEDTNGNDITVQSAEGNDEEKFVPVDVSLAKIDLSTLSWPKVHFFSSFFLSSLSNNGYDYNGVRRWTRRAKIDVFALDKIIIPVHLGNHWCLAVINFFFKRFEYYDSLGGSNDQCIKLIKRWLDDEWKDKKYSADSSLPNSFDTSQWKTITPSKIPRQQNGYDCGVFACTFADYVARGKPFDFGQSDMPAFRNRMIIHLLRKIPLPIDE